MEAIPLSLEVIVIKPFVSVSISFSEQIIVR
jgi:hypothetical protein